MLNHEDINTFELRRLTVLTPRIHEILELYQLRTIADLRRCPDETLTPPFGKYIANILRDIANTQNTETLIEKYTIKISEEKPAEKENLESSNKLEYSNKLECSNLVRMKKLSTTLENYLEAIYETCSGGGADGDGAARSKDIALRLAVKPASVTVALRSLVELGLIEYEPYGRITLTKTGRTYASRVSRRHVVLADFFTRYLGVPQAKADAAACRAEHILDDKLLERLSVLMDRLGGCPRLAGDEAGAECCCERKRKQGGAA